MTRSQLARISGTLILVVLSAVGHAAAAPFTFSLARVSPGDPVGGSPNAVSDPSSVNLSGDFGLGQFDGSATADATFGILRAFASVTLTGYQPESFQVPCVSEPSGFCIDVPARALAGFNDTLTIGTGFLSQAFLTVIASVEGTSNWPVSAAQGLFNVSSGGFVSSRAFFDGPGSITVGAIPIALNTPFDLFVSLGAFALVNDAGAGIYNHTATADYGGTASILGFRVFSDVNLQNEITNFTLTAQSGTIYPTLPIEPAPVPEPSTILLFGTGLAAAGLRAVRRRIMTSAGSKLSD